MDKASSGDTRSEAGLPAWGSLCPGAMQATACVWSMRNSETSSHNPRKLLADSLLGVTQCLKPPLEQKETEPMRETEAKARPR